MRLFLLVFCLSVASMANASVYSEQNKQGIPMCDDTHLKKNVINAITQYQKDNPPSNIIERRKQQIILKKLENYDEVSVDNFSSEDDFNVASKLIMVKVNNSLSNENIRLCKSSINDEELPIYLMIYYLDYEFFIDILNFAPVNKEIKVKYQQIG